MKKFPKFTPTKSSICTYQTRKIKTTFLHSWRDELKGNSVILYELRNNWHTSHAFNFFIMEWFLTFTDITLKTKVPVYSPSILEREINKYVNKIKNTQLVWINTKTYFNMEWAGGSDLGTELHTINHYVFSFFFLEPGLSLLMRSATYRLSGPSVRSLYKEWWIFRTILPLRSEVPWHL